ncbi:MAG: YhbY family RNA-binding protein [Proteobacteria bacterium]|nr:YhbY family RNA-binding protein [Pseudomonadota bacterium]
MSDSPLALPELAGFQKRHLRSLAQRLDPVVWVGDEGLSAGVLRALREALAAHELVKVRMRAPADKRAAAAEFAEATGAVLVGLIGHTVILYRRNPDAPKLELPTRDA